MNFLYKKRFLFNANLINLEFDLNFILKFNNNQ